MIIGIWRAPRDNARPLEDYKKFQHDVVVPEMKTVKGCLGIINFHTEAEWGTIQIWESREADEAEDTSPQSKRIGEKLAALGLLHQGQGPYETVDVPNGFAHKELLEKFMK